MAYVTIAIIAIWSAGLLLTAGRWMHDIYRLHSNLTPEGHSDYMKPGWWNKIRFRFSNADPDRLTETGRTYLCPAV